MMWIKSLIFIGIAGVVFAADDDIYCYSKKMGGCSQTITDLCSPVNGLGICVSNSALGCNMKDDKDVKSFLDFLNNKACKDGTPMNQIYRKSWSCMSQTPITAGCYTDLTKAITELAKKKLSPENLMRESFKLGCSFNDSITTCALKNVKTQCGEDAEKFLKLDQNSGPNQLGKRLCDYVNGVSRISANLPIWVIQAAILLFIFKWSSY